MGESMYGPVSTSLRIAAASALAALFGLQPVSSFAQSEPGGPAASCSLPVLDLANPAPGAMLSPGAYVVHGTALDPSASEGSGINEVSFFLGSRDAGGIALGEIVPNSGVRDDEFSATLTLPASTGTHQFVAYARSAVTGKETDVSLPIVLHEDPSKAELAAVDD